MPGLSGVTYVLFLAQRLYICILTKKHQSGNDLWPSNSKSTCYWNNEWVQPPKLCKCNCLSSNLTQQYTWCNVFNPTGMERRCKLACHYLTCTFLTFTTGWQVQRSMFECVVFASRCIHKHNRVLRLPSLSVAPGWRSSVERRWLILLRVPLLAYYIKVKRAFQLRQHCNKSFIGLV